MSMGFDDDDPRREHYRECFAAKAYAVPADQLGRGLNVEASKFRAGAMGSRFGLASARRGKP